MAEIILGIDPGSRNTGFSILTRKEGVLVAMRCDVIRLSHLDDHADRLQLIFERVSEIVRSFEPDACAVETPVYGVDPLAMLKLGRAQAAAMLAITSNGLAVTEYYPKEVKKSITGNGNADKKQVAYMLRQTVRLPDEDLPDDATDALAVAWCHLMKQSSDGRMQGGSRRKQQNRSVSSWEQFVKKNPDRVK
ncbi:MAG: crossover junction endodeoxyribonuclease RuvC [Balneolaceae bacterium]|nr:crossover junction endodeoxyribonuclease RuvC [Balneolaceae bacterium]